MKDRRSTKRSNDRKRDKRFFSVSPWRRQFGSATRVTSINGSPNLISNLIMSASTSNSSDVPSTVSTDNGDGESINLDDIGLGEVGFMFDSYLPTTARHLEWQIPGRVKPVHVVLQTVDGEPGALQSGHYLWPAAELLIDFILGKLQSTDGATETSYYYSQHKPSSLVELGAGCALASIAALQIWQSSLQCAVITDHDPGVLERARDNSETTIQSILEQSTTDSDLNSCINNLASIPVCFEQLEWGKEDEYSRVLELLAEHIIPPTTKADLVLGSDVIYDANVAPLIETAMALGNRLLLAQSFAYNEETEREIDRICQQMQLERRILYVSENGERRVQEFVHQSLEGQVCNV